MRLCFAEDHAVTDLEPLTLTRPAFALRLGGTTLAQKSLRAFGIDPRAVRTAAFVPPHLAEVTAEQNPEMAVNETDWPGDGRVVVVNSRWVPGPDFHRPRCDRDWVGYCEGEPACATVASSHLRGLELHSVEGWFEEVATGARRLEVGGEWVRRPWDLVAGNARHLARDFTAGGGAGIGDRDPASLTLVGPIDRLRIDPSARVDPCTVLDTTGGPVTIEAGAVIQPFTRVEGPCYIGRDTQLFRANIRGGTTLGPNCRIGGEVEVSIVHGHSNKYHEGFLGHAYIGEWVNLGAITSNSDLRNDYGEVSVPLGGNPIPTGQVKVGCFIGDHSRTGIGSMMNTGTAIGVMCNVLPAGPLLPKHVPSFSAVLYGRIAPGFSLGRLLATARTVTERRGIAFSAAQERLYRGLFERTRLERERTFPRESEHDTPRRTVTAVGL